ncbi:hypothetical protein BaRGS_00038316, partial [Batillaria attramentaria]
KATELGTNKVGNVTARSSQQAEITTPQPAKQEQTGLNGRRCQSGGSVTPTSTRNNQLPFQKPFLLGH